MLLVGYVLSAVGPLAFGIARDVTSDFGASLGLLIAMGALLVALCAGLRPLGCRGSGRLASGPPDHRRGPRSPRRPQSASLTQALRDPCRRGDDHLRQRTLRPDHREAVRRPVEVDRGHHLPGRIRHGRGDR